VFFHPDTDWKRVRNHVPHGVILALICLVFHWGVALIGVYLFVDYENNEDRHTKDQAWKDELGALIGYFIAMIIALFVKFTIFLIAI